MKNFDWKLFAIIGVVILSLLILLLGYMVSVSNTVARMEEQINESYSGIEIQQKHRNDSITQLVQVVENFTSHEQDVVDSVTNARAALQNGDVAEAMRSLNVVVENYPEIKSDTVYENLMNEISICENTIIRLPATPVLLINVAESVTKVCAVWNTGYISTTGNIAFGVVGTIQTFQTVLTAQCLVPEFKPLK